MKEQNQIITKKIQRHPDTLNVLSPCPKKKQRVTGKKYLIRLQNYDAKISLFIFYLRAENFKMTTEFFFLVFSFSDKTKNKNKQTKKKLYSR